MFGSFVFVTSGASGDGSLCLRTGNRPLCVARYKDFILKYTHRCMDSTYPYPKGIP